MRTTDPAACADDDLLRLPPLKLDQAPRAACHA
jgi:hypothetical protein